MQQRNEEKQKTLVPSVYVQQIILSCKGHGKDKRTIQLIIQNILAQQCNLRIKDVNSTFIYRWLIKIVRQYTNPMNINNFIDDLFYKKTTITIDDAIKSLISILASIDVLDECGNELIHLKPNKKILDWIEK